MPHEDFVAIEERESERNSFLQKLYSLISEKKREIEGEIDNRIFDAGIAFAALDYLLRQSANFPNTDFSISGYHDGRNFFTSILLPHIKEFSHVEAEQLVIIAEVFEKSSEGVTRRFHQELLRVTIHERAKFLQIVTKSD